jgi:putative transposase
MRARGYQVESICRVLTELSVQVAPRTYRNWKTATPCARTHSDARLIDALRATIGTPGGHVWASQDDLPSAPPRPSGGGLHRGSADARRHVRRDQGPETPHHHSRWQGGKDSRRAPDLLDRDFSAAAPNRKWVTDFTYCRTWSGFVYVAFVVDCFSRAIVGWHVATSKDTAMVTTALKMALWQRDRCRVDSSQRCRCTIYLDCVRGNACAGGDCSIYW